MAWANSNRRASLSPDPCAQWVTARAAGILIPDPAGGAEISSCEELRKILLETGAAVMRLMTPDDAPRFRVHARVRGESAPLFGMGCWQTQGGVYVSSGVPWTRCDRIGEPEHECASSMPYLLGPEH